MKNQKLCVILIAAAFVVSAIFSCAVLMTVKRVETEFIVSENTDVSELSADLDKLKGKSVLFFSEKDVLEILKDHPYYFLADKPQKVFPNELYLKIKQRREVYRLCADDKCYMLDGEGYLLSIENDRPQSRMLIDINLTGISIKNATAGEKLSVDDEETFGIFLETTASVDLTDNVKSVTVLSEPEKRQLLFETYTGVTIEITDASREGKAQAIEAFRAYNENTDDYYKWRGSIKSVLTDEGEIRIVWNKETPDGATEE